MPAYSTWALPHLYEDSGLYGGLAFLNLAGVFLGWFGVLCLTSEALDSPRLIQKLLVRSRCYEVFGGIPFKTKIWVGLPLLVIAGTIGLYPGFPLARFAWHISGADRIVASDPSGSVNICITGQPVKELVQAVASAERWRVSPGWTSDWRKLNSVQFFKGKKQLGRFGTSSLTSVFFIDGRKYYDDHGILFKLVLQPLREGVQKAGRTESVE
jgi:hypothetical protein